MVNTAKTKILVILFTGLDLRASPNTIGIGKPFPYVTLSLEAKVDLLVWLHFLRAFNGKSFFHSHRRVSSTRLCFYTDASESVGFGAIMSSSWIAGDWPEAWKTFHVTVL